eukprot:7013421-Prymnesium_polylepis.3
MSGIRPSHSICGLKAPLPSIMSAKPTLLIVVMCRWTLGRRCWSAPPPPMGSRTNAASGGLISLHLRVASTGSCRLRSQNVKSVIDAAEMFQTLP